jgi:hypothetical protein
MATIQVSWGALVLQADPDHTYNSNNPVAYEFTSPGRAPRRSNEVQTHENGQRIFREHYKTAGPYSTVAGDPQGGLIWNGTSLVWNGAPMIWGAVNP